jgi:hypothetical protein
MQFVILKTMKTTKLDSPNEPHAVSRAAGLVRVCAFLLATALFVARLAVCPIYAADTNRVASGGTNNQQPRKIKLALPRLQHQVRENTGLTLCPVDIVFAIDTTGSMGDVIDTLKTDVETIANRIRAVAPNANFGAIKFRDHPDIYTTDIVTQPTADIAQFSAGVNSMDADGGGDWPEAYIDVVFQGVNEVQWRFGALKILMIIGDAPPHDPVYGTGTCGCGRTWSQAAGAATNAGVIVPMAAVGDGVGDSVVFDSYNYMVSATGGRYMESSDPTEISNALLDLINTNCSSDDLQIIPAAGFASCGPVGGPFTVTNEIFTLTNIGITSLDWSIGNTSSWLDVSPVGGTLAAGASTNVAVSLNSTAYTLPLGVYTATVWFTNLSDNVAQSRQFTLTVTGPPLITCSSNITATACPPGAVVNYAVTVSGGCPPITTNCVPPSHSMFPIGTTTVNCSATDACGRFNSCSFTVTVSPPPLSIMCSSNISVFGCSTGAVVNYSVNVSGGCPPITTNCVPPKGSVFPIGTTTVNCSAMDSCGQSNSCSFTVTVSPPPPVSITCPSNISVIGCSTGAVVNYAVSVSGGLPPFTTNCVPPKGSVFPIGTTIVNCSATDACGQSANCSFTVTVSLPPPVSITCPGNITVTTCDSNGTTASYAVTANGGLPSITVNCVPPSGSTFPIGTTTVNCSATDACGQSANCSFTVTVGVPPTIVSQPQSLFVTNGATASFSVSAAGTPSLYFQWQKNGANVTRGSVVSGSTDSTLTLSDVTANDAGAYWVTITNALGSVTSSMATLTFPIPPTPATVTANPLWTDTGITLAPWSIVTITATGWWTPAIGPPNGWCGPDGFPSTTDYPDNFFSGANWAALIAYVGDDPNQGHWGDPGFFPTNSGYWNIGSSNQFVSPSAGELWLGMNADAVYMVIADNAGSVTAQITGTGLTFSRPTLQYVPATRGLNLWAINSTNTRSSIETFQDGSQYYMWAGGNGGASYSFTVGSLPTNLAVRMYLIPTSATESDPDWTEPDCVLMDLGVDTNGIAEWFFRWKTNAPQSYGQLYDSNAQILLTNPTYVGKWTLSFDNTETGVTMTAPGSNSINFVLGGAIVPDISGQFGERGVVYLGVYSTDTKSNDLPAVLTAARISGPSINNISNNWLVETNLNTYPPNSWVPVKDSAWYLLPTTTNWWVNWTLPDWGFALQTNSNLSQPVGWSTNGLPAAMTLGDKKRVLVVNPRDLHNSTNLFFRLSKPGY